MRRDQHQTLITLALTVLDHAAYKSRTEAVATPAVRLALRVLLPYVADRAGLVAYWDQAQGPSAHPWLSCRRPYYAIAAELRQAGWHAAPTPAVDR